jgi:hypothetical protein
MTFSLVTCAASKVATPGAVPAPATLSSAAAVTSIPAESTAVVAQETAAVGGGQTAAVSPGESTVVPGETRITSDDGLAVLRLPIDARAQDSQGNPVPLETISITARDLWKSPDVSQEIAVVGKGYVLSPEGATLEPPGSLTVTYDPTAEWPFSWDSNDCSEIHMAYHFDANFAAKSWLEARGDTETHSVTAQVDQLTMVVLFCVANTAPMS